MTWNACKHTCVGNMLPLFGDNNVFNTLRPNVRIRSLSPSFSIYLFLSVCLGVLFSRWQRHYHIRPPDLWLHEFMQCELLNSIKRQNSNMFASLNCIVIQFLHVPDVHFHVTIWRLPDDIVDKQNSVAKCSSHMYSCLSEIMWKKAYFLFFGLVFSRY